MAATNKETYTDRKNLDGLKLIGKKVTIGTVVTQFETESDPGLAAVTEKLQTLIAALNGEAYIDPTA